MLGEPCPVCGAALVATPDAIGRRDVFSCVLEPGWERVRLRLFHEQAKDVVCVWDPRPADRPALERVMAYAGLESVPDARPGYVTYRPRVGG
jgi:hypothetical protein